MAYSNEKELQESIEKDLKKKIVNIIFKTHAEIVRNTPVDTGRLRQSIVVEQQDDGYVIGTNIPYAEFVELGVAPHTITPKNKQALKFNIGGKDIFAKKVEHPGFEGRAMFQKGVGYFEKEIKSLK